MLFTQTTFIGIDPTAGQRPFTYAALDHDLHLLALGQCRMEDVLAFTAGQRQAVVAVCAPQRPSQRLMEQPEVRARLSPPPRPGRWQNFRLVEYQLRQHNITCPQTYPDEESCPNWMQMGFSLYRRLAAIGYQPYPSETSLQWMEVYPHACFTTLLGQIPFPKATLEGRIQRQLILHERDLRVPDPMRFFEEITRHRLLQGVLPTNDLYQPEELDALIAAYTAWLAAVHRDQVMTLGDPADGQMVLPVPELKRSYGGRGKSSQAERTLNTALL